VEVLRRHAPEQLVQLNVLRRLPGNDQAPVLQADIDLRALRHPNVSGQGLRITMHQLRADYLSETDPISAFWERWQESATGQRNYSTAN